MANPGIYLEIDASELNDEIRRLESVMRPEQFTRAMYGIMRATGRHVSTILKQDLPEEYQIKKAEISGAVQNPRVTTTFGTVGCAIPIVGPRRGIGGEKVNGKKQGSFDASGSRKGWASKRGKYKIKAKIVKSGTSVLPYNMNSYGGNPPFRNSAAEKLHMLTFTRTGKNRLPIQKVTAIAIPQMPMNRSRDEVQKDIIKYLEGRIEHRFQALLKNGR